MKRRLILLAIAAAAALAGCAELQLPAMLQPPADQVDSVIREVAHLARAPAAEQKVPYVTQKLGNAPGVFVAASDYLKALPDAIDRWLPRKLMSLGTDGFGRSESRADLRNHFEVDARFIVVCTLSALMREGQVDAKVVQQAIADLGIDAEKKNPAIA